MATFVRRLIAMMFGTALLAFAAGCNNNNSTIPSAILTSDDFSGTLAVGGESVNLFTVSYGFANTDAGVTVKSLTSAATGAAVNVPIGVAFGQPNNFNGQCVRGTNTTNSNAVIGTEVSTAPQGPFFQGQYCVVIFDPGTLSEAVKYTLTVRHY